MPKAVYIQPPQVKAIGKPFKGENESHVRRCSEPGCDRRSVRRQLCNVHYLRRARAGLSLGPTKTEISLAYLEACVATTSDACMGHPTKPHNQYPKVNVGNGDVCIGRLVLERLYGPCPDGQEMRHLCGNIWCCSGKHLVWGTHIDNMDDWSKHGHGEKRKEQARTKRAKLTEADAAYIRTHWRKGSPRRPGNALELAEKFGVTRTTIYLVGKGKIWS